MLLLEAAGYRVTRAAAPLGAFDLIGIGSVDVVLCQVKSRDWPGSLEMEAMRDYTASCAVALGDDGVLYVRDMIHGRWEWPDAKKIIMQTMLFDPAVGARSRRGSARFGCHSGVAP